MKRVYLGNTELTTIATVTNGGGGGDDTKKWVDYFNGTLTEFTVPEGVTKINPNTFVSCTGLTSLTLPSSVTSIGRNNNRIFANLKTLTIWSTTPPILDGDDWSKPFPTTITAIYVPASSVEDYKVTELWSDYADKIQAIAKNETVVIYNNGTKKEFSITGELTKDKIENITAATKVYIGTSVTSIGNSVFWGNSSITTIVIPSSVKTIGIAAFRETNITSIIIPDGTTKIGGSMCWMCSKLKSAIIPASVTSIEPQTFRECPNLTSVTIKNSNSKLAYNRQAFEGISSSAKLYVPSNLLSDYQTDSNWTNAFGGGIYAIGTSMIVTYLNGSTKEFTGLTSIEENTDSNKKNAKEAKIFDTVKTIGGYAFAKCTGLTSVTLSDSITEIMYSGFRSCSSLKGIIIPDNVKQIGDNAFNGCTGLTSVTIGESMINIVDNAFDGCTSLSSVIIKNSTSKIAYTYNAFKNISSTAKLYVPSSVLSDYQADSAWTGAFKGGIFAIQ